MSRLLAISDIHLDYAANRRALAALPPHPEDHLLVPGDVGDDLDRLEEAWEILTERFASVTWTPGNHELWDRRGTGLRGVARYEALVAACRRAGVRTPADPPWRFDGAGGPALVVPLFLLYDYSLRPPEVPLDGVRGWAAAAGIRPTDERFLGTDPFPDISAWNATLVAAAERRLDAAARSGLPLVVTSHFPWRHDLNRIERVHDGRLARFLPWCGTRETEGWHRRWPIRVVVHGHLHMRATDWRDGVRFEEVAVGTPRHWRREAGFAGYLREILPGPASPDVPPPEPTWHR